MTTEPKLRFKLKPGAILPTRATEGAVGYDLSSYEDKVVPARGHMLVKTGVHTAIPEGHYGRVASKSGLAWKKALTIGAGVIDRDYRGDIGVVMFNHSDKDFDVKKGDQIAQLILEKCSYFEVEQVDELDETERGEGGFGSTDKRQRTE